MSDQDNPKKRARSEEGDSSQSSKASKFHRGKWTHEECEYMLGLMEAFKAGHLPLREGTTLRSFLSSMMKCKPKRISKKFEGISYNGRMLYQRSKEPISLQAAMLLRDRLSELERRYLAAAAEQKEVNGSMDNNGLFSNIGKHPAFAEQPETKAFAADLYQQPDPSTFASMPPDSSSVLAATPGLAESTLGASSGLTGMGSSGLGLTGMADAASSSSNKLEATKPEARLLGAAPGPSLSTMTGGASRGMDGSPSLLESSTTTTSINALLHLGGGNADSFVRLPARAQAEFTGRSSLLSSDYCQSLLQQQIEQQQQQQKLQQQKLQQQIEQQQHQKLASLSSSNTASTLAAIQLRERTLAAQLSELRAASPSDLSTPASLHSSKLLPSPLVGRNSLAGRNPATEPRLPSLSVAGYPNTGSLGSSVQHNLDLNRYVLQSPEDDATYFRQRLLPGVAGSLQSTGPQAAALCNLGGGTDLAACLSLQQQQQQQQATTGNNLAAFPQEQNYNGRNLN